MQLPQPLEPWRAWLVLFPPEMVEPIGELLLRLHPLVGRLNSAALRADDMPAGVGDIVRRGLYERLLMTEWMYADAEPDEFLRRAGSGELLFTGPEPEACRRARRCVTLFDAGPAQLGEPRLAHMALFILLARRAEEAGAEFLWGILQQPGKLLDETGQSGLQHLLAARTLALPGATDGEAWDAVFDNGIPPDDCWYVGGAGNAVPHKTTSRVAISRELLTERLRVVLTQRYSRREALLDLPSSAIGVRLLREPFRPIAPHGRIRHAEGRPSLKQPPRFAAAGPWLAVPQLDGGAVVFHVPQSPRAAPGKFRVHRAPEKGSILAAGIFRKSLSCVTTEGDTLTFSGFPGELFSRQKVVCQRPPMEQFRAPVGLSRWLPAFFFSSAKGAQHCERVLLLDIEKRLVCWEYSSSSLSKPLPDFRQVAMNVIGVEQFERTLIYAVQEDDGTRIYRWDGNENAPGKLHRVPVSGRRVLFGNARSWHAGHSQGLLAVQRTDSQWWVGTGSDAHTIDIADDATVLGVASLQREQRPEHGLVVLHHDKKVLQFRTRTERRDLLRSAEPIAQVAVDPMTGRIAWLTYATHELTVRGLEDELPLLQVTIGGAAHAI
jgi:hypothetical protein